MKGVLEINKEIYVVDKEKKTVTYIIKVSTTSTSTIAGNDNIFYNAYYLMKYLGMKNYSTTVSGVAKCSPNDEFDEKKGIQIARNRAEIKVAQLELKAIRWFNKHMNIVCYHLEKLGVNRYDMICEKKNFIKNI